MAGIERITTGALSQNPAVLSRIRARQDEAYNHTRYLFACAHYPAYESSSAEYFSGGEACFAAMLATVWFPLEKLEKETKSA